ncbi:hypothetical protein BCR39DRAFT_505084 [Naematelia encephala]|uniref:Uncharacterized protein n=1 Tax=Naematelia encephala TaxID=71784 RepID=A0A1Y2B6U1_9TREE|nr:hypothetical protein BCR39DRAFT_505084 [Naematelia encephala]
MPFPVGSPAPMHNRISLGERPRRPSPLLHEIQPPSRRLSSHQMLLLTPFGESMQPPSMILGGGGGVSMGMGMSRGSSSMGSGANVNLNPPHSAPPRMGSIPDRPFASARRESGGRAAPIGPSPTAMRPPVSSRNLRNTRHHSLLSSTTTQPSPLASAPLTTIPSETDSSECSTRESSSQGHSIHDVPASSAAHTVPMMRSNSLPVMTLRELQALKEKDGELGITRGGNWAWISRDDELAEESEEDETPALSKGPTASASSTSLQSTAGSTPPSRIPFTFSDPFASTTSTASGMVREGIHYSSSHPPSATTPGYHYSPTYNDTRRMSETPSAISQHSPRSILDPPRRPSAPGHLSSRSSILSLNDPYPPPPRSSGSSTRSVAGSVSGLAPPLVSDRMVNPEFTNQSPPRSVRLMRYKSAPGRATGLGLQIKVRDQPGPSTEHASASSGSDRRESSGSEGRRGSHTSRGSRRTSKRALGSWAAVDVVESLPTDLETSPASDVSGRRRSIQLHLSDMPSAPSQQNREDTTVVVLEQISSRAPLSDFGLKLSRASISYGHAASLSALGGRNSLGGAVMMGEAWVEAFPRRGSLAVLSRTPLGPWARSGTEAAVPAVGIRGTGVSFGAHWSERRGSWAEGWGKD